MATKTKTRGKKPIKPAPIDWEALVFKAKKGFSYSAYALRKSCELAHYWRTLMGAKEDLTGNPYIERGNKLHKEAEDYIKGDVPKLSGAFYDFRGHYKQLKKLHPIIEKYWGVDKRWRPINFNSFAVMKMDAALPPRKINGWNLFIQDLKSGREYPEEHKEQGELYAAIGFGIFPDLKSVDVEFWYIDQGYPTQITYKRSQVVDLVEKWQELGRWTIDNEGDDVKAYPPTPTPKGCNYCFVRSDKGGPCTAWKKIANQLSRPR